MPERRTARSATRGLASPMHVDDRGSLALSTGLDSIEQSMRAILLTVPGERVMRPDFGCEIWQLMTVATDAPALERMTACVRDAMVAWESRVEVNDVAVRQVELGGDVAPFALATQQPVEGTCVDVDIAFTERATATRAIAQFRCLLTREPAIVVRSGESDVSSRGDWTNRYLLQRVRGAS